MFVLTLFMPLWLGLFMGAKRQMTESTGRETSIEVPLRVSREFHRMVGRKRQRKLRALLKTVPVYARLLEEYPGATIRPGGDRSEKPMPIAFE